MQVQHSASNNSARLSVRGQVAALLLALALAAALYSPRQVSAQAQEEVQVIGAWVQALQAGSFEAALDLLDDGGFVTLMQADTLDVYEGRDVIERFLRERLAAGVTLELIEAPSLVMGTVVWTERQRPGIDSDYIDVRGEALVSEGKIVSLIYTLAPLDLNGTGMPTGMPDTGAGESDLHLGTWLAAIGGTSLATGLALEAWAGKQGSPSGR